MEDIIKQNMPNKGTMLQQAMDEKRFSQTDLANATQFSPMVFWRMVRQDTIQAKYLWQLGKVMGVNFF